MKRHSQLKGDFVNHEPYLDYNFHIAIENIQSNHYFSEKNNKYIVMSRSSNIFRM